MIRVGVIAVGKCYTLEVCSPVQVGEDGLYEGVGTHGESDLA